MGASRNHSSKASEKQVSTTLKLLFTKVKLQGQMLLFYFLIFVCSGYNDRKIVSFMQVWPKFQVMLM